MRNYPALKRLNFFTGFFTTADDWTEGQAYHLEKTKLHNRGLHTPGVIPDLDNSGKQQGLAVNAAGGLQVTVSPGAALDGEGNLLCLATPRTLTLKPPSDLPKKVYLYIKFDEQFTNRIENVEDPDFSGFARQTEEPIIDWTYEPPNNIQCIELAHIELQSGVTEIVNASDPDPNKPNRITLDGAPKAGAINLATDQKLDGLQDRLAKLHQYHLDKEQRHNHALHTPGLLRGIGQELKVVATGGLTVEVQPGAALDGVGNELYLEQAYRLTLPTPTEKGPIYIVAKYEDHFADYLVTLTKLFGGNYRTMKLTTSLAPPDNQVWLELAHVALEPGATEIHDPVDPANPQNNEIDERDRVWAGSKGVTPPRLPPELQTRIDGLMQATRTHFVELTRRFPVPVLEDVRHAAVQLKLILSLLEPEQLPDLLKTLAGLEMAVQQELVDAYPSLQAKAEFQIYQAAIDALLAAFKPFSLENVLTRQDQVAEAAHSLATVVFPPPIADAGPDQVVEIVGNEAKVLLDASGSRAGDKQRIIRYRWEKVI